MKNLFKMWESVDFDGNRLALHWTYTEALDYSYEDFPFRLVRMRKLPRWTRPLHRWIWW